MDIPVLRHQHTLMGICSLRRQVPDFTRYGHSKVYTILQASKEYDFPRIILKDPFRTAQ